MAKGAASKRGPHRLALFDLIAEVVCAFELGIAPYGGVAAQHHAEPVLQVEVKLRYPAVAVAALFIVPVGIANKNIVFVHIVADRAFFPI